MSCLGGPGEIGTRLAGWTEADIEVRCVEMREGEPRMSGDVDGVTTLGGRKVIRAAIVNHHTTIRHADQFLEHLMATTLEALTASRQQRPSRVRRP